jgi:hypothetical protein
MGLDDRTREDLERWLRKAGVYAGTFVAGGFLAFTYTYYSLHSSKEWKIEHLEERLQQETIRSSALEGQVGALRSRAEGQPDREAFDELQEKLAGATTGHGQTEDKLRRVERKVRDLEKKRGSWRAKYAQLEKSRDELALELATTSAGLLAAEKLAMERKAALDTASSRRPGRVNAQTSAARPSAARPGNRDSWEAGNGSRSRPANLALEGAQSGTR